MRIFIISFIIIFSACSAATDDKEITTGIETCDVLFKKSNPCIYMGIKVRLVTEKIADDEKKLKILDVTYQERQQLLKITEDSSMLEGDRGYISFADINFDGTPDIAITTSFGLANLYLDYWVYDTGKNKYIYLGNFTEFKLDKKQRTLSNVTKMNAAKYTNATFLWKGYNLVEK